MLLCPPPQSLQIISLQGQGIVGRPRVQDKGRLTDSIPGMFSRCGFVAPRLVREIPCWTATKPPPAVVQLFSIAGTTRCSLFLYHPPSILMYSYSLELAKRPLNVLSSRTYCTTPSAHLISFSLDSALYFFLSLRLS